MTKVSETQSEIDRIVPRRGAADLRERVRMLLEDLATAPEAVVEETASGIALPTTPPAVRLERRKRLEALLPRLGPYRPSRGAPGRVQVGPR